VTIIANADLADWRDRAYVSQFSRPALTHAIYIAGEPGDPDGQSVTGQLYLQNADGAVSPVSTYSAVRQQAGVYVITPSSADTSVPSEAELAWAYSVGGQAQQYASYLTIGPANPAYDALPQDMQDLLELVWIRFADEFDSASGGPNLQSYFQAHWSRGRIAQLMAIAVSKLNTIAQPWSNYTLDGQNGAQFPVQQWGGLLGTYCVTMETPVLTADLRWVPCGELRPGDQLIGFDEQLDGLGKGRSFAFRRSIVEVNEPGFKRCFIVRTTEGSVTATYDHKWVVWDNRGRRRWVETQDLVAEKHAIMSLGQPVIPQDFESGYLSGLYDGEGSLSIGPGNGTSFGGTGAWLYFSQNPGAVLNRFLDILKSREFDFTVENRKVTQTNMGPNRVSYVYLKGGMPALIRMLADTRPERFMARDLSGLWEGRQSKAMTFRKAYVLSVEDQGLQQISGLQTSTRTFIANGMLCHNTFCEAMKHLIRAYNEQPNLVGGSVTRLDRRDYTDRWRESLRDEQAELKSQLDVFKIRHLGLGNPKVLVSGGTYGRYAPTRIAGSVAARPRMWARWY
jgi:hypothetical protein